MAKSSGGPIEVVENDTSTPVITGLSDVPIDPEAPYKADESHFAGSAEEWEQASNEGKTGRPKKTDKDGKLPLDAHRPYPVPTPPFRLFKSDSTNLHKRPKAAYGWWNQLPSTHRNNVMAYVYREHPILLDPPEDADGKPVDYKYIDKIDGNEPLQDDMDLLNRYGCGSYKLILSESGPGRKRPDGKQGNGELCQIFVMGIGGADYRSNPPNDRRINNPANLDITNPANNSYIAFLRGKGIIPEAINKEKEAEEMASIQAVQQATEQQGRTIEKLTDKVLEFADRQQAPQPQSNVRPEDVARAVKDANRELVDELRRVMNPTPTTPQKDPMELALQLVTLMNSAKESSSSELAELRAQVAQQNQSQLNALMEQVRTMMEARTTGPTSSSPFGGVADGLEALKKMKDTFEDLGIPMGGAGGGEEAAAAAGPKWLQQYAPLIQMALPVINNGILAFMNPRTQVPMPTPTQPMPTQTPGPQPVPNPAPTHNLQGLPAPMSNLPPELTRLLDAIATPLRIYLTDTESTGTSFANWFSAGYGEDLFDQVISAGPEQVGMTLAAYPATAQAMAGVPVERIQTFLAEFCNPKDDEDQGDGGKAPGPVSVPPTPTSSTPPVAS